MDDLTIANDALTLLGADRLEAIDEETENGRKVRAVMDNVRKSLLRKTFWKFALKELALAKLVEVPVLDTYTAIFQLPADYIRMKTTNLDQEDSYRIKGRNVYANSTTLSIEYVRDVTDPTEFDAGFVEAFTLALACKLTYSITTNATLKQNLYTEARFALNEARSQNSQEDTPEKAKQGSWIRARSR